MMKLSTKIALGVFVLGIIIIGGYIYLVFNGNPIIEHKLSLEEKAYAESKYGIKVKIINSEYNFKEGSYQTTLKSANQPAFLVYQEVQPGGKKAFMDTYPEVVIWTKELKEQTFPTIKNLFNDASKIDISVPTGSDYTFKDGQIPSFRETENIPYQIDLTLNKKYTENENKRIFEMIDFLKKEEFRYGIIFVRFQDKTINIPAEDIKNINSESNIKAFIL